MDIYIKKREIHLNPLHPDPNPARSAMLALSAIDGIERIDVINSTCLLIRYHLLQVTLAEIDTLLQEHGYHLDNSLIHKLKRALYYYTEETERANFGCPNGHCKTTRDVFIHTYLKQPHGCRDPRPQYWRDYL